MNEFLQISLIIIIALGHVKLYLDDGIPLPLSPVRYNRVPYGFATYWIDGKFVSYIDLRQ
jgi:hypothetical protein